MENQLTGYPSIDKPWLKYYSEEIISAKLPEYTIYEYLWNKNKDYQDNVALNYFGKKITFGKLFENIDKSAKAFSSMGVKEGDIVTICSVSTPEIICSFYGLNHLGAVSNMIDPRTNIENLRKFFNEVNSAIIVCLNVAYEKIKKAAENTSVRRIVVVSVADSLPMAKKIIFEFSKSVKIPKDNLSISWNDFIKNGRGVNPIYPPYKKDRCCVLVRTGGTTGIPKGVMLTNDNLNAAAYQCDISGANLKRGDIWMNIMPPFIAYGVGNGLHAPLIIGMQVVLIPKFNPDEFADLLLKYRPNHMAGVPAHYEKLIYDPKMNNVNLSFIVSPIVGGDTMNPKLENATNSFLNNHNCMKRVIKGYGMSEVCAAVSLSPKDEYNEIGSVGIPFSHSIISVFDPESGNELTYNELGEICISSPNTMLKYYKNDTETQKTIMCHNDGLNWVHSKDIGYMKENGVIFIVDRIKRMIIRPDGHNVWPSIMENVILKHNDVAECTVVGIQRRSNENGRIPTAFIVLKNKRDIEKVKQEIIDLGLENLPERDIPMEYRFIDKTPLTSIGKVDYRALEELIDKNSL